MNQKIGLAVDARERNVTDLTRILLCNGMDKPVNVYGNVEVSGVYLKVRLKKDAEPTWIGPSCFIGGKAGERSGCWCVEGEVTTTQRTSMSSYLPSTRPERSK